MGERRTRRALAGDEQEWCVPVCQLFNDLGAVVAMRCPRAFGIAIEPGTNTEARVIVSAAHDATQKGVRMSRKNVLVLAVIGACALTGYLMSPLEAVGQGPKPGFTIAPLPLPVTDADHPDRNAFAVELCATGTASCDSGSVAASLTAPADKTLVIDVFSGECSIENAGRFRSMRAFSNDVQFHQFVPERALVGSSHTIYDWNTQTRMVIPANGTFRVSVAAVGGELAYCRFFVSGYSIAP